ncbi:probable pathogenesis-related protein ARB_02861 [Herrania umbratica]|uniref:Probable pathogenesis-related protein ARB_02861 n=1 Tax=Herrania umbratica TaxID=108875 RepID=A0A6J1BC02_9ROSI|nr:probable pathogenesis-related protein ARB_02861 [Herrania umbratica]
MAPHTHQKNPHQSLLIIFLILSISFPTPINASTKKLEEIVPVVVPQAPTTEIKCGTCPCVNPCDQQSLPPPPPPPPSPPPPPRFIYCDPVPTTPPPPRFYYVTGVPGQLYTADADDRWTFFSSAGRNVVGILLLSCGFGLLGLLTTW